jgi:hypothetical protein
MRRLSHSCLFSPELEVHGCISFERQGGQVQNGVVTISGMVYPGSQSTPIKQWRLALLNSKAPTALDDRNLQVVRSSNVQIRY